MSALQLSGGQLAKVNGRLQIVSGLDEIAQKLQVSLQLFWGEWFLNTDVGVQWYERIFIKSPQIGEITATLRRVILAVPGIAAIDSLDYDFDTTGRQLTINLKAIAVTGEPLNLNQAFTPFATSDSGTAGVLNG